MATKENDVFYLKLQWIASKDELERSKLAAKIRQMLAEQK
jgi:predicted DNA-binding ribbon-helix-helix protein